MLSTTTMLRWETPLAPAHARASCVPISRMHTGAMPELVARLAAGTYTMNRSWCSRGYRGCFCAAQQDSDVDARHQHTAGCGAACYAKLNALSMLVHDRHAEPTYCECCSGTFSNPSNWFSGSGDTGSARPESDAPAPASPAAAGSGRWVGDGGREAFGSGGFDGRQADRGGGRPREASLERCWPCQCTRPPRTVGSELCTGWHTSSVQAVQHLLVWLPAMPIYC